MTQRWIGHTGIKVEKLYAQLCCLLYLENVIHPRGEIRNDLTTLFSRYPNVDLRAMGFPDDWSEEPLWK